MAHLWAGLTRFDRLETPLSASYHQAVAQWKQEGAMTCSATAWCTMP